MSLAARLARGTATLLAVVAMVGVASLCARAQPAPSAQDLTLPPDMRHGAPQARQARETLQRRHAERAAAPVDGQSAAARQAAAPDAHPVDLGVTMRGGSGAPRVYGATGTSEAIQESGSAFGAAMKFGF